jgi:hypothetical protein
MDDSVRRFNLSRRRVGDWQPGDDLQGEWPRARLVKMNQRFVERVERAFENGGEHRQSAATRGADSARTR